MNQSEAMYSKSDKDLDVYSSRHVAMAARLDDQAQVRLAAARREHTLAHVLLIIVALLLGIAAASALKPFFGGVWIVAFAIGVVIHLALGGGVEAIIYGRSSGNGLATFFGAAATAASIILLLGVAVARTNQMAENGKPVGVAAILSLCISFFEIGLPSLVGFLSAQKAEKARYAREDLTFYKELHGQVVTAPEDAPGLFEDAKEELRDQIQHARAESTGAGHERKNIAELTERLRTLKKADPGCRYKGHLEPIAPGDAQPILLNGHLSKNAY